MMNKIANTTAIYWLAAAFAAGFFVVGFPYWQIPYANVSLPDTLYGAGLLAVGVLAAAARAFGKARLMAVVLVFGAAVPAAVLARVVVDTAKDPTSHNLWPLELIIAAVVGIVCSFAGALVEAYRYFSPSDESAEQDRAGIKSLTSQTVPEATKSSTRAILRRSLGAPLHDEKS